MYVKYSCTNEGISNRIIDQWLVRWEQGVPGGILICSSHTTINGGRRAKAKRDNGSRRDESSLNRDDGALATRTLR